MKRSEASYRFEIQMLRQELELARSRLEIADRQLDAAAPDGETGVRRVAITEVCRPAQKGSGASPIKRRSDPDPEIWPRQNRIAPPSMRPTPGKANPTLESEDLRVVGFSVCGLGAAATAQIVSRIAGLQTENRDFIPVFLTDSLDSSIFREQGFVFEYIPGPGARRRLEGRYAWKHYASARLELLREKYGLCDVITFGPVSFGSQ